MKKFIFLFGPPASGKGTQIELLSSKEKFRILSIGKLLRREKSKSTKIAESIKECLDEGKLVDDSIVELLIDKEMRNIGENDQIIFDGYPRNKGQLVLLESRLSEILNENDEIYALYINIGSKEIIRRLGGRRSCSCGATYHVEFNAPKVNDVCDNCGKGLFVRADDNRSVIKERIKIFDDEFKPIVNYWRGRDALIEIDGERDIGVIEKDIDDKLRDLKVIK